MKPKQKLSALTRRLLRKVPTDVPQSGQRTEPPSCACSSLECCEGLPRREFLRVGGIGLVATSLGRRLVPIMAGPFGADDTPHGHLIPADKRLNEEWVKGLFARGVKEVYRGKALDNIGMPCCGIGTGQLYLCGDGTLGCWQIFNNARSNWVAGTNATYAHRGIAKPVDQGFVLCVQAGEDAPQARKLSKDGFPDVAFQGEYPIGVVRYAEEGLPVTVEMEAFSPFIPLNAKDSALPATIFHITVQNVSRQEVRVHVAGWLENAAGCEFGPLFDGMRKTRFLRENGTVVLMHSSEEAPPPGVIQKPARRPILFADFEGDRYGRWKTTGTAFGKRPALGTLPNQNAVSGFQGKGLVNSFVDGDASIGTLTSPSFVVKRKYVNFLIGGGDRTEKTCINLVVDGAVVRTATGRNSEQLAWAFWDVRELEGKKGRLVIVDHAGGGWGHISIDQIEFADTPRRAGPAALSAALDYGSMALAGVDANEVDGATLLPMPAGCPAECLVTGEHVYDVREKRIGLVQSKVKSLAPGDRHAFTFVLAWHFPNQPNGHEYAARFEDAAAVARYVLDHHDRLTADTRLWRDTYYDSTLPYWLLDRLHSTVSTLAAGTCQWWKNGRFWAWEGVACCEGTCTHVWNYAHAHARLFPELARSVREMQDFNPRANGGAFHPDTGLVGFRSDDAYAADGQCGTILKAYREHLLSEDDSFLERNWPAIKKALEFSISHDGNADGLIEDTQHNTYDIDYEGANTFVGSLYLAALRAAEEMAKDVGDENFAAWTRAIFESGRRSTLERLWNGEYFVQDVDLEEFPKYQYKGGCLSDHLFGQGWAHQVGLGYIYPEENVRSALQAIWKYNWAPDITPYNEAHTPFRWFVSPGQAGLLTCTWPKGDYLPEGTLYKDEVWTGIEYQVAGNMIWDSFLTEGLAICRAVHDRYQPELFNPYNEIECGDHYARAMASWGVYLALAGFTYHGPKGHIGFAPRITPEDFRAAFTAAEGWGTFHQIRKGKEQRAQLQVRWGSLRLRSLSFDVPDKLRAAAVRVAVAGKPVSATSMCEEGRMTVTLAYDIAVHAGETLDVVIGAGV